MANWKHNAMKETGFWLLIIVFKYHCLARPYGHESALSHGSMQKPSSVLLSSTFGHMPKSMVGNHNYVVSLRGLYTKRFVVCDRCYDLPILTKVEQMKYTIIGHPKTRAASFFKDSVEFCQYKQNCARSLFISLWIKDMVDIFY